MNNISIEETQLKIQRETLELQLKINEFWKSIETILNESDVDMPTKFYWVQANKVVLIEYLIRYIPRAPEKIKSLTLEENRTLN